MLLEQYKELARNNIPRQMNEETLEIMSYVITAIALTREDLLDGLLEVLKIPIYAENKSISEISREHFPIDEAEWLLTNASSCSHRILYRDDKNNFLNEKRAILISLPMINSTFRLIEVLIHEFFHCLRFFPPKNDKGIISVKDGISIATYNPTTKKGRRKHHTLEEGIVQMYTNQALDNLYNLLIEENVNTEISKKFKEGYNDPEKELTHFFAIKAIRMLCHDPKFKELIENSFKDPSIPSPVVTYFNDTMHEVPSAFRDLGDLVDMINENLSDINTIRTYNDEIGKMIDSFLNRTSRGTKK